MEGRGLDSSEERLLEESDEVAAVPEEDARAVELGEELAPAAPFQTLPPFAWPLGYPGGGDADPWTGADEALERLELGGRVQHFRALLERCLSKFAAELTQLRGFQESRRRPPSCRLRRCLREASLRRRLASLLRCAVASAARLAVARCEADLHVLRLVAQRPGAGADDGGSERRLLPNSKLDCLLGSWMSSPGPPLRQSAGQLAAGDTTTSCSRSATLHSEDLTAASDPLASPDSPLQLPGTSYSAAGPSHGLKGEERLEMPETSMTSASETQLECGHSMNPPSDALTTASSLTPSSSELSVSYTPSGCSCEAVLCFHWPGGFRRNGPTRTRRYELTVWSWVKGLKERAFGKKGTRTDSFILHGLNRLNDMHRAIVSLLTQQKVEKFGSQETVRETIELQECRRHAVEDDSLSHSLDDESIYQWPEDSDFYDDSDCLSVLPDFTEDLDSDTASEDDLTISALQTLSRLHREAEGALRLLAYALARLTEAASDALEAAAAPGWPRGPDDALDAAADELEAALLAVHGAVARLRRAFPRLTPPRLPLADRLPRLGGCSLRDRAGGLPYRLLLLSRLISTPSLDVWR